MNGMMCVRSRSRLWSDLEHEFLLASPLPTSRIPPFLSLTLFPALYLSLSLHPTTQFAAITASSLLPAPPHTGDTTLLSIHSHLSLSIYFHLLLACFCCHLLSPPSLLSLKISLMTAVDSDCTIKDEPCSLVQSWSSISYSLNILRLLWPIGGGISSGVATSIEIRKNTNGKSIQGLTVSERGENHLIFFLVLHAAIKELGFSLWNLELERQKKSQPITRRKKTNRYKKAPKITLYFISQASGNKEWPLSQKDQARADSSPWERNQRGTQRV